MNAKLKKGSSFTWQSIMTGVNTLNHGYIWRVGNGQKIDIWEDAWIPNFANIKVITPKGQHLLSKVSDFIDPFSNGWDEDLIRQTLWPIDSQQVLATRLPQFDMSDFVAWSHTKNGICSLRSIYFVEWDHQHGRKLRHTNGMARTNFNAIWCKIWNLSCPAKVNFFYLADAAWHSSMSCYACQ